MGWGETLSTQCRLHSPEMAPGMGSLRSGSFSPMFLPCHITEGRLHHRTGRGGSQTGACPAPGTGSEHAGGLPGRKLPAPGPPGPAPAPGSCSGPRALLWGPRVLLQSPGPAPAPGPSSGAGRTVLAANSPVLSFQMAEQLMTLAYDNGINLFDTAEVYAAGKYVSLPHGKRGLRTLGRAGAPLLCR